MGSLPWILAGVVMGGIIHIACVFSIPWLAERDAWSRLSGDLKSNTLVVDDTKSGPKLPFDSRDVITAYCLFDLSDHNVIVKSPLPEAAWSLSLSSRDGENFYVITGADSKKPEVRLLLIRRDRLSEEASTEKSEEGDDQNIIVAPGTRGIVAIRAPIRGESFRSSTAEELRKAKCETQKGFEPMVASVAEPQSVEPAEPEATPDNRLRRDQRRRRRR